MVCTEISHLGDLISSTTGKHNNEDIRKSRRRTNISNRAGQRGPAVKGPCCQAGGHKADPPNQMRGTDSRRLSFDISRCAPHVSPPHISKCKRLKSISKRYQNHGFEWHKLLHVLHVKAWRLDICAFRCIWLLLKNRKRTINIYLQSMISMW